MHMAIAGPGDGGMLMEACHSIIAMDHANNDEGRSWWVRSTRRSSTTTPYNRLWITIKFNTDRIRTIKHLHELSNPGRIRMDWDDPPYSTKRANILKHDLTQS